MSASRAHILKMPPRYTIMRSFMLVTAIIILGLTAWSAAYLQFSGNILSLATALMCVIVNIWIIVATHNAPRAYNYWAVLSFEVFFWVFWLASFAILALQVTAAAVVTSGSTYYDSRTGEYYRYSGGGSQGWTIYLSILGAAAGLGAIEFLLYFISLIITSVFIHRHRRAGGHSKYSDAEAAIPAYTANPATEPLSPEKYEMNNQTYPVVGAGQNTAYNPNGQFAPQPYPQQTVPAPAQYYQQPPQ